jgi:hypothetical protein
MTGPTAGWIPAIAGMTGEQLPSINTWECLKPIWWGRSSTCPGWISTTKGGAGGRPAPKKWAPRLLALRRMRIPRLVEESGLYRGLPNLFGHFQDRHRAGQPALLGMKIGGARSVPPGGCAQTGPSDLKLFSEQIQMHPGVFRSEFPDRGRVAHRRGHADRLFKQRARERRFADFRAT